MKKLFLGVGVNGEESRTILPLRGCDNDLENWKNLLISSKYGFDVLATIPSNKVYKELVLEKFRELINQLNESEGIGVFFFSGHGDDQLIGPGPNYNRIERVSCNNDYIPDYLFRIELQKFTNIESKLILIFDCCYSWDITNSREEQRPELLLAAGGRNQRAKEMNIGSNNFEGVFSHLALKALDLPSSTNYERWIEETNKLIKAEGFTQQSSIQGNSSIKLGSIFN